MARYSGIVRVRQDNRGLADARNAGFRASTGDYVLFLDVDDRLTPNAVEAHLSCFAKRPEAGFVVGDIDQITLDGSYMISPRWPVSSLKSGKAQTQCKRRVNVMQLQVDAL